MVSTAKIARIHLKGVWDLLVGSPCDRPPWRGKGKRYLDAEAGFSELRASECSSSSRFGLPIRGALVDDALDDRQGRKGGRRMRSEEVWSWGAGTHGQLACGTLVDALTPQRVDALSGASQPILSIACGGAHAIAVFESGEVATWGRGQAGCLGQGDETSTVVPRVVTSLQGIRIRSVAAGWNHSAFVSERGQLYTCGDGAFGQLGHGHTQPSLLPCHVENLSSVCITMAACGMRHTLALALEQDATAVYAFGSNKRGQLGIQNNIHGSGKDMWCALCPQKLNALQGIVSLSANGDHSAALTGSGGLFLWGRGYDNGRDLTWPHRVSASHRFYQVSLGWRHGLALTDNNEVYAWGSNQCGQLGVSQDLGTVTSKSSSGNIVGGGDDDNQAEILQTFHDTATLQLKSLQKVDTQGKHAVWVSAGSEHSAAVLENGDVVVWGWAEHGQLGLGSTKDQGVPDIVLLQDSRSTVNTGDLNKCHNVKRHIYCGSGFTFVV